MAEALTLFILALIIVFGLIAKTIFKKTKIPDVLLLILLGAILSYLGLVDELKQPSNMLTVLTTFALIYIVFNGGLPIKIKAVFSSAKWVLISSILHIILTTAIIALIARIFFTWELAFLTGILLCVLDGSIINGLLEVFKFSKRGEAFIQLESALTDIFVIVFVVTILNFAQTTLGGAAQQIINFLFLSTAIGVVLGFIWTFILKKTADMQHAPITTMAVLILVYVFAEYFAANGVIAVFVFSIVLGNTSDLSKIMYKKEAKSLGELSRKQKDFFEDLTFLLRTLLFVYMGALINFSMPWYLLLGLGLILIVFTIRSFIYRIIKIKDIPKKEKQMFEVMATKGLTPIVLLSLIQGTPQLSNTILGAIFSSVILSSIFLFLIEKNKFTTISDLILKK